MLIVKDSMVLIHLAKISLLEKACDYFNGVLIPSAVFQETVTIGKEKKHEDAFIIELLVKNGKIAVKNVRKTDLIKKANDFNVFGGEAEAVALYWQENANLLATDDDNVRGKKEILEVNLVGTPSIILELYRNKLVEAGKAKQAINRLRKIGWFSSEVLDNVLMEVEKNG